MADAIDSEHWLLLIIMAIICPSCNKALKNNQGLSTHRRTCLKVKPMTIALLKRQKAALALKHTTIEASESRSGASSNHDAEQSRDVHILFC